MTFEYEHHPAAMWITDDPGILVMTIEEADDARRHAAEMGDYVTAQRWLRQVRQLAAQQGFLQPPARKKDDQHDPLGNQGEP